jgi:hypothetical protein
MRRFFLALFICTPLLIFSQKNNNPHYTISGKIIDASTQLPIEDATVIFKTINSEDIDFGGITNQKGKFSIDVKKGIYNAYVEFLSYQTKRLNISSITKDINVGVIELELDTEFLSEIEITAEKNLINIKPKKQIYNVSKDVSALSATATEVLSNIPTVTVDPSGAVKLRGLDNITILINGKISTLSKSDALKSLPANTIESIEVISNPGARYRASSSGIINIILKKGTKKGLNSSFTLNGGYKDYYGGLLTMNHKTDKINFFTNTSFFKRNPITLVSLENEYFNNGNTSSFLNESRENDGNANVFISQVGMEFFLSDKSTLTTSINYTNINAKNKTTTNTEIFDASKVLTSENNRFNDGRFHDEIVELIVDFEHNFNEEGEKITSYVNFSKDKERYINKFTNTNSNFINENYIEENTINNTEASITFVNPINETSNYEVGYLGEFGTLPLTYKSNSTNSIINFNDNVHSIFSVYTKESGKFYYELGLRAEFSKYIIDYASLNIEQTKTYNDLFPSFYIEYKGTDAHSLDLSYSRGIFRPRYIDIQPFEQKISETITFVGNEDINPMYFDMVNFSYMYHKNGFTLSASTYYDLFDNSNILVTYEPGDAINGINKILRTPQNIGQFKRYGFSITAILKASKWLNFTGNANLYNWDQTGIFEYTNTDNQTFVQDYTNSNFEGQLSLLTKVKLPNKIDLQINVKHELESEAAYSKRKAYSYVSAAITKDILDNNATLSLSSNDIFNSVETRRDIYDTNYFAKGRESNKYRTIILSFTYRFNQKKQDRKIDFEKKEIKPKF